MNKLFKLARQFELKLVFANSESNKEAKVITAKENLAAIIEKMASKIAYSKWFEPYIQSEGAPYAESTLNDNAKLAVFYLNKIWKSLFEINKKIHNLGIEKISLDDIIESLNTVKYSLIQLSKSHGRDKINKIKNKYLYLYDLYFCTSYKSAITSLVNSQSEGEDVNVPVSGFTEFLGNLAEFYQGNKGIDSINQNLVNNRIFTVEKFNNIVESVINNFNEELEEKVQLFEGSISDVRRQAKPLKTNFERRFVIDFRQHLGFDLLGVKEEDISNTWRYVWDNYIKPLNLVDEARVINNAAYRTPVVENMPSESESDLIARGYIEINGKWRQLPAATIGKIREFKKQILHRMENISQELTTSERVFGDIASREGLGAEIVEKTPEQKFFHAKSLNQIADNINSLKGIGAGLWSIIPLEVQIAVRNGRVNLESALQVADLNKSDMNSKHKLNADLFKSLYTSTEIAESPIAEVYPEYKEPASKKLIDPEELKQKAHTILKELRTLFVSGGGNKEQRTVNLSLINSILERLKRFSEGKEDVSSSEMASFYPNYKVGDFKNLIDQIKIESENFGEMFAEEIKSILT